MLARDYLNLSQVRLKKGDCWVPLGRCLNFVIITGGYGQLRNDCGLNGSESRLQPVGDAEAVHRGGFGSEPAGPTALPGRAGSCCQASPSTSSLHAGLDLESGDVLVFNGVTQAFLCTHSRGASFAFSTFTLCMEHLFPIFAGRDIALLDSVKATFEQPKRYAAVTDVAVTCKKLLSDVPAPFELDHRCALLRVASTVISEELRQARTRRSGFIKVEEHIEQVLESLSIAEILHASVESLAKRFSCTSRHLNRLFHQHFGCSVATFKMEMRLLRSASLLCNPSAKIVQVAAECGFNYVGRFNERFKKRFGTSPSEWRQKHPGVFTPPVPVLEAAHACAMRRLGLCPWRGTKPDAATEAQTEEDFSDSNNNGCNCVPI